MMKKVLIINDSRLENMILRHILSILGFNVKTAEEYDAISEVKNFNPEVVLINLIMRDIYGDQLAVLVKRHKSTIKCVLFSNNPISLKDYENSNVDGVFQTPTDVEKMSAVFKQLLWCKELQSS